LQTVSHEDCRREVSIYNDSLTPQCVDQELKKLVVAFPAVDPDFINVLSERLVANGFTNRRLKDAIGSLIDNFKYQKPNISDIISFDRKIKLYSYGEAYRLIERGEVSGFSDFDIIEVNGDKYRIKKSDKINLP
jgi:hypothetical protein